MSATKPAEQQEKKHETFVKNGVGLTSIPAKVMALSDLELLDVSDNAIEIVPKGLFPNIDKLKHLDLSHNSIKSLPDDLSALKLLEVLSLGHNKLTALPDSLYSLTTVRELNVSHNLLDLIPDEIGQMEALTVLSVAGNRLRALPCEIGWLGLKQLNISENPDLNIPEHVMHCGFRAVMCYLQVIGEQHQLVSHHMGLFTAKLKELQQKHGLVLGPIEDEGAITVRRKVASRFGILACSHCQLTEAPPGLLEGSGAWERVQVLDLSHNRLREAPQEILQGLHKLLVANLSFNNINTFSSSAHLSSVAVLNLSFNKLTSLPQDLGQQLPGLQQLYLANNYLSSLPDSLDRVPLHDLFLSENAFEQLPQVLQRCTGLMKLSLAACRLTSVGNELNGLSGLRFLDLSFNKLGGLPDCLSSLVGVERLNLGFNPLPNFPDVLTALTNLKELNIDYTGISSFPDGLGELRQLEGLQADGCQLASPFASLYTKDPLLLVKLHDTQLPSLDLSDVGLEEVPQQMLRLTQLTSLSLLKNSIKDLPLALGDLRQLQQLCLKGNPLRQPYLKIMDAKGELSLLAFLRPEGSAGALDLEGCGFEALPREVWQLPGRVGGLMELNLNNNRLRDLPEELSTLTNLTQLVLDNNLLRQLPPVVLTLPALTVLMASNNSITYLPETLGAAQQLQALLMHGNQLMQLPDSITTLTNLRALGMTSNRLWQLPAGLATCSGLRLLDCSHNLLSQLPVGLGKLQKLRSLKLTHNKLGWISVAELRELPALAELHLAGNTFSAEMVMNASDPVAVEQLLSGLADTLAAQEPAPEQRTYERNTSNASSNGAFDGAPMADGPRTFKTVRSRFGDDSRMTSALATSKAAATAGKKAGVTWGDDASSCSSGSSQRWSGVGAQAAVTTAGGRHTSSSTGSAAAAASSAAVVRHSGTGFGSHLASPGARSSADGSVRDSSLDGSCLSRSSLDDAAVQAVQCEPAVGQQQQPQASLLQPIFHPTGQVPLQGQPATPQQPTAGSALVSVTASGAATGSSAPASPVPVATTAASSGVSSIQPDSRSALAAGEGLAAAGSKAGKLTWPALFAQEEGRPAGRPMQLTESHWDKVPLMDLPGIIKALTAEPPPPPPPQQQIAAVGAGQSVLRPQSKARFKRVIEQTTRAMALLETMAAAGVAAALDDQAEGATSQ